MVVFSFRSLFPVISLTTLLYTCGSRRDILLKSCWLLLRRGLFFENITKRKDVFILSVSLDFLLLLYHRHRVPLKKQASSGWMKADHYRGRTILPEIHSLSCFRILSLSTSAVVNPQISRLIVSFPLLIVALRNQVGVKNNSFRTVYPKVSRSSTRVPFFFTFF